MLAQLWIAEDIETVLDVLARSKVAREHEVIHELHAQAMECQRTAPAVAAQLDRVAGQLTEIHAGLRAAEDIEGAEGLVAWRAEADWRRGPAMQALLAAVAASHEPAGWPWRLERLPALYAALDRRPAAPEEPDDDEPQGAPPPCAPVSELVAPWHRADPVLEQACLGLVADVSTGRRSLPEALGLLAADDPEHALPRQTTLLMHLLEDASATARRAALVAWTRLVASLDARALEPEARAEHVGRWAIALVLGWRVLADPPAAFDGALRLVDHVAGALPGGSLAASAQVLVIVRARLLRRLAGWRDGVLDEAEKAHHHALTVVASHPSSWPRQRGRLLLELAGLRRTRRGEDPEALDREVRALHHEALDELRGSIVMHARALADFAVYLAQPLRVQDGDAELALALAHDAVARLEALPPAVRDHSLMRMEEASHRLTLGNLRLEVGSEPLAARQAAATHDYHQALARVSGCDEVLAGLVHLSLAFVTLADVGRRDRDDRLRRARQELDHAAEALPPLPVAHARAVAERAMLAVRAAPEDEAVRERSIREVEAALHRLPLGVDRVVRARVLRQLGELHLQRDAPEDLARAAECFATARSAFVEGGAVRLAVEVARDYAEAQLRQHADDGDPAALLRGVVVLEQSALLAEQRWAAHEADEWLDDLTAMLDGIHGDLAWLLAKLERPAEAVLHAVTRAKRYRAHPSLLALRMRAERSSMLSPVHVDPLARRSVPAPVVTRRAAAPGPSAKQLAARASAFAAANPQALALDLTLTRWGTVAVCASAEGIGYTTVPLSRETVRRWVWGDAASPGWWASYLAHREALARGDEALAAAHERAWSEAGGGLAAELGARLLEPVIAGLGRSLDGRALLLAPGRLSGLPFAVARVSGQPLVARVKALAHLASLAELPHGALPSPRPRRALCVMDEPDGPTMVAALEELHDVVRLLASGQAEVEVVARAGREVGEAAFRPPHARTRERTRVSPSAPTVGAVLERLHGVDHLFYAGLGWGDDAGPEGAEAPRRGASRAGLRLVDERGAVTTLDAARLGPRPSGSACRSVLLSARRHPPTDDRVAWDLAQALHDAGVGLVVLPLHAVPSAIARELVRGFYLYWALGRSPIEAFTAALANLAGSDPSRIGGLVASLGAMPIDPDPPAT